MYAGMLLGSTGLGIAVAGLSSFAFGHPWWVSILLWSLTGTVVLLGWVLHGVTHEDRYAGLRALADCEDEPGVQPAR